MRGFILFGDRHQLLRKVFAHKPALVALFGKHSLQLYLHARRRSRHGVTRKLEQLRSDLTGSAQLGLKRRERMLMELLVFDEANFPPPEIPSVSADVLSQNSLNRIKELMVIVSGSRDTSSGDAEPQRRG
jgi:hypothetical protein